jgi:alkylation response protein AidB-like acyl-CoA dehydrogenase
MLRMMMELMGWLGVLVSVAGVAVSAFAIGRTRWALVLLGGFAGEAVTGLFYRIVPRLYAFTGTGNWQIPYLFGSVLGLAAHAAVVAGVAGLLYERSRNA